MKYLISFKKTNEPNIIMLLCDNQDAMIDSVVKLKNSEILSVIQVGPDLNLITNAESFYTLAEDGTFILSESGDKII